MTMVQKYYIVMMEILLFSIYNWYWCYRDSVTQNDKERGLLT